MVKMPPGNEEDSGRRQAYEQKLRAMQQEEQKKQLLRKMLDERAYDRMMNVRLGSPELYDKVIGSLAYLAQSGKPMGRISDEQLYQLLLKMTQERETKIEFRHK